MDLIVTIYYAVLPLRRKGVVIEHHSLLDLGWTLSAQEVSSTGTITYLHMASSRNQVKPSRNQKHPRTQLLIPPDHAGRVSTEPREPIDQRLSPRDRDL